MTGQQLKNSILQWAIQGKLVPQDPTDEPASELLERICTEKAQLIKEGKIKKGQPTSHIYRDDEGSYYEKVGSKDPVCINHEIPFDLPSGWEWCRLSDIGSTMTGKTPPKSCRDLYGDDIPFLGPGNILDDRVTGITQGLSLKGKSVANVVPPLTVLQVCIGSLGKCAIVYDEVTFNQQINSITPILCDVAYVQRVMMSELFRQLMLAKSTGTTIPIINRGNWETILFPLPPLEEQKRIVARIEELMPLVEQYDKAHSEWTRLNDQLPEQLKKSILQEAIQGKLVPQDPTDEPASVLLERIRTEKVQLIKEGKIKKGQPTSHIYRDDEGSYYEKVGSKDPVCINHEIPFDLPPGWEWCRLGSLVDFRKNQSVKADEISKDAWLLDLEDIEKDTGTLLQRKRMGSTTSISNKHRFIKGNVLYSKLRPYLNKVIIADEDGYCTSEILCLDFGLVFNKYAQVYLMSPMFVEYAMSCAYGVKMPRLGSEHGNNALYPLPPLEEQKRIVARIEELMPRIDKLR